MSNTRVKKEEFKTMAANANIPLNMRHIQQLIDLAMTIEHDRRPRLDSVRSWAGLDFSGNSYEAMKLRTRRN